MKLANILSTVGVTLFLTMLSLVPTVQAVPTLKLIPEDGAHSVGDAFTVHVVAEDFSDLYAFQFGLAFEAGSLAAIDVLEGSLLGSGGEATFFINGSIDNVIGSTGLVGGSLIGLTPGVSGTGILATITFQALIESVSLLTFLDVLFLNSSFDEIGVLALSSPIGVGLVSEPPAFLLVLIAVGGLIATRRRPAATNPRVSAIG